MKKKDFSLSSTFVSTQSELRKKVFRYSYVDSITGASGRKLRHGVSIAVDPSIIKLGEQICIEGFGIKSADDITLFSFGFSLRF